MRKIKFLPSVTTISMSGPNDWRAQIEEVAKFGLTEIALFPTGLKEKERYELYEIIRETTQVKNIPFVHLRTDMKPDEIEYLIKNFNAEVFNLHTTSNWPLMYDYSKYAGQIFIENGKEIPVEEELSQFSGLCIDFAHWDNQIVLGNLQYQQTMLDRIGKFTVGVGHLSAMKEECFPDPTYPDILQHDSHSVENLKEFDYLKKYQKYMPPIAAIELENSIAKQLEVKKYLEILFNQ